MKRIPMKKYFEDEMEKLRQVRSVVPQLMLIRAPESASAQVYIDNIKKDFAYLGWVVEERVVDSSLEYMEVAYEAVERRMCVMIMQPCYRFNAEMELIPAIDVDGALRKSHVRPATVQGILNYLEACDFDFYGKKAVVVGRGHVGKNMAKALSDYQMTVTVCHSRTPQELLKRELAFAELAVFATGRELASREDCPFAVVMDVGGNEFKEWDSVNEAGLNGIWSTKVGKLTRLGLLENCLYLTDRWTRESEEETQTFIERK